MNWDHEVDMVCTGSGAAGLASAISVDALGGEVFVADSPAGFAVSSHAERLHPWLSADISDAETNQYFAALSSDLGPFRRSVWDADVPICVVHEPPVEPRGTVAPFVGARLREWAARCLASSYGYLYTRVTNWQTTTLHTAEGELIEVAEIGSMSPDPENVGGSVLGWLTAQAHDRRIEVRPRCSLQRIVFEEGMAVGAVFTTPEGTLAVRARQGVTVVPGGPQVSGTMPHQLSAGDADLRVCLVTRYASRFGRVELLTSEPLTQCAPSACRPANRALHVNLHETHGHSHTWRCGKVDGYPSPGK